MKSEEAIRQMLMIIKFFGHKEAVEALEWVLADEAHNPELVAQEASGREEAK